eukprot:scaffold40562_cov36-Phaeocystis_antarctica.AAC.1
MVEGPPQARSPGCTTVEGSSTGSLAWGPPQARSPGCTTVEGVCNSIGCMHWYRVLHRLARLGAQ